MISKEDVMRIRQDAAIAMDALESLRYAPNLCEEYVREKIGVVRRVVDFIENFEGKKEE